MKLKEVVHIFYRKEGKIINSYNCKKLNVLLFANYSFLNKGCEAMVFIAAKQIKELNPNSKITVATFHKDNDNFFYRNLIDKYVEHRWEWPSLEPEKMKTRSGLDVLRHDHEDVLNEIERNDICIAVGGDTYCYDFNAYWMDMINSAVKKKNKKLVMWPQSINEDAIDKKLIEDIRKFDLILTRESFTYNILSKYVNKNKLILTPDAAFALESKKIELPYQFDQNVEIIGLNLSTLVLKYQTGNVDIIKLIYALIDYVLKKYPYIIALIPHVYKEGDNDLDVLRIIKQKYSEEDRVFIVDKKIYNCSELKFIISKCKLLIAARTHASVAGYSTGVPSLVLGYSIKSKGIARDIFGDYSNYVLPVQDMINDADVIIEKFEYLLKNEENIKQMLSNKMPSYKRKADNLFNMITNELDGSKLIMTLLVRNEIDIIRHNIEYHLDHGVDFIIATDNGSIDGTRDVLVEYEKKGLLHLIDEKEQNHNQAEWVNRMGKIAIKKYKADIIFHCDADEFWCPSTGDLKSEICKSGADYMNVDVFNVLPTNLDEKKVFPFDLMYMIVKPKTTDKLREDSKRESIYAFKYPQKVIFKTGKGLLKVSDGNHSVLSDKNIKKEVSKNIKIIHFPIRGRDHFYKKVREGGLALSLNKKLDENIGWHWRRWYDAYLNGKLESEYNKLLIKDELINTCGKNNILEKFNFDEFIKG